MATKRKRMKLQNSAAEKDDSSEDMDEVEPKRKKRAQKKTQNTRNEARAKPKLDFMSMNDDCLQSILRRLPVKDLCSVSQTCSRLQSLATSVFIRCHKERQVTIKNITEKDGSIDVVYKLQDEDYIKCFGKHIQNVTFGKSFKSKKQLNRLSRLYKREKLPPITTLTINGWLGGLGPKTFATQQSKELIKHVESLTIASTKFNGDLNECILKYMPQLKRLTLWEDLDETKHNDQEDWMSRHYPKLEYFAWHLDRSLPIQRIKTFFALNPNITHFSLKAESLSTLRQLQEEAIRVNELYFTFEQKRRWYMPYIPRANTHISDCLRALQNLCEENLCRRLHLKVDSSYTLRSDLNQFIPLCPYIEGLYFNDGVSDDFARTIITCDRLKVLQLRYFSNLYWLSQLKSLDQLFAYDFASSNKKQLFNCIVRTPNLKKIYMRLNLKPFEKIDFSYLDAKRLQLDGVKKLKIYLKTDETTYGGTFNDVESDHNTIEVLRIETERVDNPLASGQLTSA